MVHRFFLLMRLLMVIKMRLNILITQTQQHCVHWGMPLAILVINLLKEVGPCTCNGIALEVTDCALDFLGTQA